MSATTRGVGTSSDGPSPGNAVTRGVGAAAPDGPANTHPLLTEVDRLWSIYSAWMSDGTAPEGWLHPENRYTPQFTDVLAACIEIAEQGDIPANCLRLANLLIDLERQWSQYLDGNDDYRTPSGQPRARFLHLLQELPRLRAGVQVKPPVSPPPVAELLKLGCSARQIAEEFYGFRGEGPFLVNGVIDFKLLGQEAQQPGSVVPAGWINPREIARYNRRMGEGSFQRVATATPETTTPAADIGDGPLSAVASTPRQKKKKSHTPPANESATPVLEAQQQSPPARPDASPGASVNGGWTEAEIQNAVAEVLEKRPGESPSTWLAELREQHADWPAEVNVARLIEYVRNINQIQQLGDESANENG